MIGGYAASPGDVINTPFTGANGETKNRYAVIVLRIPRPPAKAEAVLVIACCSETKGGAQADAYSRIETSDLEFSNLKIGNASTFHRDDVRAVDVRSPILKKLGFCGPRTMLKLKKLVEDHVLGCTTMATLPKHTNRAVHAAVTTHLTQFRGPALPPDSE